MNYDKVGKSGYTLTVIGECGERIVDCLLQKIRNPKQPYRWFRVERGGGASYHCPVDFQLGKFAVEVKTMDIRSLTHRIVLRSSDRKAKIQYAKEHGLVPMVILCIIDYDREEATVYGREGSFGSYRVASMKKLGTMNVTDLIRGS